MASVGSLPVAYTIHGEKCKCLLRTGREKGSLRGLPPCAHPSGVFILQDGGTEGKVLLRCHHFIYLSRFMLIIR